MLRGLKRVFVAPLIVNLVCVLPLRAEEHLVTSSDLRARLTEAASARQADLATLSDFLESNLGRRVSGVVGADAARLRVRMAQLSDSELHDLAVRTRSLRTDPAAGRSTTTTLLIIGGIVLGLVLILAIDSSAKVDV
jgi:hypothetical protein